jgi:hypothetical protein
MPRYFCRVCDSNNGWTRPGGLRQGGHHADYGFAYEEWNFDFTDLYGGWKYGWIEGFYTEIDPISGRVSPKGSRAVVPWGVHDVRLYVYRRGPQFDFVGRIRECEHIPQCPVYTQQHLARMVREVNAAGADIRWQNGQWMVHSTRPGGGLAYPFTAEPNMRFKPEPGIYELHVPSAPRTGPACRYHYHGPLLVDGHVEREKVWNSLP